jgi:hypothetical protein
MNKFPRCELCDKIVIRSPQRVFLDGKYYHALCLAKKVLNKRKKRGEIEF